MNHLISTSGTPVSISSTAEWEQVRQHILSAMQTIMGPLPGGEKRCALDVQILEEVDCGLYIRRLITYASEPQSRTPAYLLVPKQAIEQNKRCPAVICPHPTDNVVGHKVVVGLSTKVNRSYASELAEQGFVTIAPSYPLLANYQPDLKGLGYQSGTMKAIWDNIRAIDLLEALPYVTPGPIGAVGHSLGGHNSVYTAVFEPRIGVIVSSCGLDSYLDYMDGHITGWTSDRYMPRLKDYAQRLHEIPFDFHDLIAALAPRPCLIAAPYGDSNFKWESVDRIAEAARVIYALYQASDNLMVKHPDCAHDFPDEMRSLTGDLFKRHLVTIP
jgi:dienelactone hydrolase